MKKIHYIILIIIISINFAYNQVIYKDTECCLKSDKYISHSSINQDVLNESIIIKNFNELDELNFNCNGIIVKTYFLIFIPNYFTLLDNTFNLVNLLYSIEFEFKYQPLVCFFRIKGFNFVKHKKIYKYLDSQEISLQSSQFQFYINEYPLN